MHGVIESGVLHNTTKTQVQKLFIDLRNYFSRKRGCTADSCERSDEEVLVQPISSSGGLPSMGQALEELDASVPSDVQKRKLYKDRLGYRKE